jgi:uncharacterized protein
MKRDRRYWLRLFRLAFFAIGLTVLFLPILIGGVGVWALTHPLCSPGSPPDYYNVPYEDVHYPTARGLTQRAYFMPGTNGMTVIVPPTYGSGRGGDVGWALALHNAGFNTITFESRVCLGQSHSLGYIEAEDVRATYDYLATRSDVDAGRVSVHGFSSAGATSIFAAAQIPELRGASAMGNYGDAPGVMGLRQNDGVFDSLIDFGAVSTYRISTGIDIDVLNPIDAVTQIAPRPIMLIYGSIEPSYPDSLRMQAAAEAAGSPVDYWLVEGAGHGGYLNVAAEEYARRVVAFHCRILDGTLDTSQTHPVCE